MSWLPRLSMQPDSGYSDDCGPDANGVVIELQWGPFIVQLWLLRRERA